MTALALCATLGRAACGGGAASIPAAPTGPAARSPVLTTAPAAAQQHLSETGSSLMAPLFALWGPAYQAKFSQVRISTATSSSGTPGSIGYVGVSYLSTVRGDGEGEVALGNSAGNYVLPTAGTIQAGLASFTNTPVNETISLINGSGAEVYPIINYEYAIVNISQGSASRAQDLRAFLDWAITAGTAQLAQVNFQPLPPSVLTLSQAQIAKIKG